MGESLLFACKIKIPSTQLAVSGSLMIVRNMLKNTATISSRQLVIMDGKIIYDKDYWLSLSLEMIE